MLGALITIVLRFVASYEDRPCESRVVYVVKGAGQGS